MKELNTTEKHFLKYLIGEVLKCKIYNKKRTIDNDKEYVLNYKISTEEVKQLYEKLKKGDYKC